MQNPNTTWIKLCSHISIKNIIKLLYFQQIIDNILIYLKMYNVDHIRFHACKVFLSINLEFLFVSIHSQND
jgi:hypothetical protein